MFLDWWLWGRVVLSLFTKDLCCISSVSSTRTPRPLIPPFCSQPYPFLPWPLWPSLYIAKAPFPLPLLAPTLWLVSGPHGIIFFSLHVLRTSVLLGGNRSHELMVVGHEAAVTLSFTGPSPLTLPGTHLCLSSSLSSFPFSAIAISSFSVFNIISLSLHFLKKSLPRIS